MTKYGGLDCVPTDPESLGISDTLSARDRKTVLKEHRRIVQENLTESITDDPIRAHSTHDSKKSSKHSTSSMKEGSK